MEYVFGIIILLGVLIFFHELGHFLVAKFFHVKVEVFSLGFGPKLLKKKVGETEYCLSLIPLGGYVKLYGEDAADPVKGKDAKRSFANQSVGKRIAIAAAGPIFNILTAIVIYFVIEVGGLEQVLAPHIAKVAPGSSAWEEGLRPNDTIKTIRGKRVVGWQRDVVTQVAKFPGESVPVTYERNGKTFTANVALGSEKSWNIFCEKVSIGVLEGVEAKAPGPIAGVTNPHSLAMHAGFKTGDRIVSLNGVKTQYWHELSHYLLNIVQKDLTFEVERGDKVLTIQLSLPPEYFLLSDKQKQDFLGLHSYEFFVRKPLEPGTAGHEAGIQIGDRLIAMNGSPITSWDRFRAKVPQFGANPGYFELTYDRSGDIRKTRVTPKKVKSAHPCEKDHETYQIGLLIDTSGIYPPAQLVTRRELNPFKALVTATSKSFYMMYLVFKSIGKMIQGSVSVRHMGGPIMIGKVAGDYLKQGILPFLALMAAISINLAILNLLPIPVLDGGHLFFFFYELIMGRRLSDRVLEFANRAGLVFILFLVFLAFFNDITRYWSGITQFFKHLFGVV